MKNMEHEVRILRDGHLALIEFGRPPHNYISIELLTELANAIQQLSGEAACRAIMLASSGKHFCPGADLARPDSLAAGDGSGMLRFYEQALRLFAGTKPVIAAVQGAAVGAGLGLALAADYRVAAADARFAANFVRLGFHPGFGLTHTLPRLIGEQRASLMFLTGRRIKAHQALSWGLVDELAGPDGLRECALALAAEIAANAPLSVQTTRAMLRFGLQQAVRARIASEFRKQKALSRTADFVEGVRAVNERRPADFRGR